MDLVIVNESTIITNEQLAQAMWAFQSQIDNDFFPVYGEWAKLDIAAPGVAIPNGTSRMVLADNSNQVGALGYHDLTLNGDPQGFVFAKTDQEYGLNWTVTMSHEILELLADPWCNYMVMRQKGRKFPDMLAYEVCDPVEDDSFAYEILGNGLYPTMVSDFVWPQYFEPRAVGPYDQQGKISAPLQILKNGYQLVLSYPGGFHQVFADGASSSRHPASERRSRRMSTLPGIRSEK